MDCNIKEALNELDKCYQAFEHRGQPMYKWQVKQILTQALEEGYGYISQIPDADIERVINTPNWILKC